MTSSPPPEDPFSDNPQQPESNGQPYQESFGNERSPDVPRSVVTLAEAIWNDRASSVQRVRSLAHRYPVRSLAESWSALADDIEAAESADQLYRSPDQIRSLPFLAGRCDSVPLDFGNQRPSWPQRIEPWVVWLYPTITFGAAAAVVLFILVFVVADFDQMFREFEIDLPLATRSLIGMSRLVRFGGGWLLAGLVVIVGLVGLAVIVWRRWRLSDMFGRDPQADLNQAAQLAESIADWIDGGASLSESIQIASLDISDDRIRNFLWRVGAGISGAGASHRLGLERVVPPSLAHALSADEPSVPTIRLCAKRFRRRLLSRRGSWFAVVFPYLLAIGLGMFVFYLVVALFLPLISLITGLT